MLRARCRSRLDVAVRPPPRRARATRPREVLEHGNRPEQQSRRHRHHQRERQHRQIETDVREAREVTRRQGHQQAQPAEGKSQSDDAAEHRQADAFEQHLARNAARPCPERGTNRQLLLPRLGSDQQQVRDVGAGDEQHQGDRAHQHPQHLLDVTDEIVLERHDMRRDPRLFEHLDVPARERRELRQRDRDQPRHLRVRLRDGRPRLQPCDGREAEVAEEHLAAIEAIGHDQRDPAIEEAERLRQHADDLARLAVDHQRFADDGVVGSELRSPVGRGQHDRFGSRRRVVGLREQPPEHRLHAENRQHSVGHEQGRHFLRLGAAGDADGAGTPEPDVLEHAPLLAIGEVTEMVPRRRWGG